MKQGRKRKKTKLKYLILCNGVLLMVLLGMVFLSGSPSSKMQEKEGEAAGSQAAQIDPHSQELGQTGSEASQGMARPQTAGQTGSAGSGASQGAKDSHTGGQTNSAVPGESQGAGQNSPTVSESGQSNSAVPAPSQAPGQSGQLTQRDSAVSKHIQNVPESTENYQKNAEEALQKQIQEKISSMTLEEKAAQLFIITPEALTGLSSVTKAGETTRNAINKYPVGGLIFFEGNIQSQQQVSEMLKKQQEYSKERIGLPLFLSVDEEGGQVTRIASASGIQVETFPDIAELGASQDVNLAYQLGDTIGEYLDAMGFNLDFAPVADVLTNPDNTVVKRRSYGSSPQLVSEMVKSNLEGLQSHQVFGCIKHFPGHGATVGDTHQGYAYTDKSWEELKRSDIIPFQDSIAWGVEFVMVGHISLPQIIGDGTPASLSPYAIGHLLREELGYGGIVLTDALNMKAVTSQYTSSQAAVAAIQAGSDMILMPADFQSAYQGILDAVKSGAITQERLEESLRRILERKLS